MLINLILTVCLSASPQSCREEVLTFESEGDLRKCMFLAPMEIVRWAGEHPGFNVTRWKCDVPGTEESL